MFARSLDYLEMNLVGTVTAPGLERSGEVADKPDVMAQAAALGLLLAQSR